MTDQSPPELFDGDWEAIEPEGDTVNFRSRIPPKRNPADEALKAAYIATHGVTKVPRAEDLPPREIDHAGKSWKAAAAAKKRWNKPRKSPWDRTAKPPKPPKPPKTFALSEEHRRRISEGRRRQIQQMRDAAAAAQEEGKHV